MTGWQDISTAPRDGSVVEITSIEEDGSVFEIWPMQWMAVQKNALFPGVVGMWTAPDGSLTWNGTPENGGPTHWRPPQPNHEDNREGGA